MMSAAPAMNELTISIQQVGPATADFAAAANEFVAALKGIDALEVDVRQEPKADTRGFITVLTGIVVSGAKIGAFKGIYTLAKDLFDRSHSAEVELTFKDGSKLKLKGLTQQEAEERIQRHLRETAT